MRHRWCPWKLPPTARGKHAEEAAVVITHPFHPRRGRRYRLIRSGHCWGAERVVCDIGGNRQQSFPLEWTDQAPPDPFQVIAAGRSAFRPDDLNALANLIEGISEDKGDVK